MESDIRFINAMGAAGLILMEMGLTPGPPTASLLGRVAFIVLEAFYSCEQELQQSREHAWLCPHCLRRLPPGSMGGDMTPPCPCCGKRLPRPEYAAAN